MQEFVVDESSGCLDGYLSYGLALDHINLNKFSGPDDGHYVRVHDVIKSLLPSKPTEWAGSAPTDNRKFLKRLLETLGQYPPHAQERILAKQEFTASRREFEKAVGDPRKPKDRN